MYQPNFTLLYPLFSSLNGMFSSHVLEKGVFITYEKNSIILDISESVNDLFIILNGSISLVTEQNGNEHEIEILKDSDVFGIRSIIFGSPYFAYAQAVTKTEMFKLNKSYVIQLLEKYPELSIILLDRYIRRKSLLTGENENRVAQEIFQLIDSFGMIQNGVIKIDKLNFRQHLFSMLSTKREYIFRTLHSFAKKGLIELDGAKLNILSYNDFKHVFQN